MAAGVAEFGSVVVASTEDGRRPLFTVEVLHKKSQIHHEVHTKRHQKYTLVEHQKLKDEITSDKSQIGDKKLKISKKIARAKKLHIYPGRAL